MNHVLKKSLCLIALASTLGSIGSMAANIYVRSQSVDSARELAGWTNHINLYDVGHNYGTFSITPEYTQSFKSNRIAECLFGSALGNLCDSDCLASFNVTGTRVANRGANDFLADYFGLPTDFSSIITIQPKIKNFLVDFDLYLGLDDYWCGWWFRVHAPVVYAQWKLNMSEKIINAGVNGYDEGYFAPVAIPNGNLNKSFGAYLNGQVPNLNVAGSDVVFQPLTNSLVPDVALSSNSCFTSCSKLSATRLSDIQFALGYNFWQNEDYHVGLGLRVVAPTGTTLGQGKNGNALFQPQIGNGHHVELGGMLTSHYTFWRNCDDTKSVGFYLDANITTLLESKQCRTFDLCGRGDNSRYMLSMPFTSTVVDNLQGSTIGYPDAVGATLIDATSQFNDVFTPVANIARSTVKVSIPVQADITAMFNYTCGDFTWDIGYNFWGTACEKIKFCGNGNIIPPTTYALKGDAYVYGFDYNNVPIAPAFLGAVALSGSQSQATIHTGTNFNGVNTVIQASTNNGVDHSRFAYGDATDEGASRALFANTQAFPDNPANPQTHTSIQPILLSDADLDLAGARSKGISNKIFTHVAWTLPEQNTTMRCFKGCALNYIPYIGVGAKVEFTSFGDNCSSTCGTTSCAAQCATVSPSSCSSDCFSDCGSSCKKCSLSEWGIWVKGGFDF